MACFNWNRSSRRNILAKSARLYFDLSWLERSELVEPGLLSPAWDFQSAFRRLDLKYHICDSNEWQILHFSSEATIS